jgi:hypothetical protein
MTTTNETKLQKMIADFPQYNPDALRQLHDLKSKRESLAHELATNSVPGNSAWAKKTERKISGLKAAATRIKKQHGIYPFNQN